VARILTSAVRAVSVSIVAAGFVFAAQAAQAAAAGDAKNGEAVFMDNCGVCHSNAKGAANKIGRTCSASLDASPQRPRTNVFAGHDEGGSHLGCADPSGST
jgi:mono/diheme cytochrome c family protein